VPGALSLEIQRVFIDEAPEPVKSAVAASISRVLFSRRNAL
jgi:hypothetical protein